MSNNLYPGLIISNHKVYDITSKKEAESKLYGWNYTNLTVEQWMEQLEKGHIIQPSDFDTKENGKYSHAKRYWKSTHIICCDADHIKGVDFDDQGDDVNPKGIDPFTEKETLYELYPELKDKVYAVGESVSSMAEWKQPLHRRFRLVFVFDEPITSEEEYKSILELLHNEFDITSEVSRSRAQPVFGNAREGFNKFEIFANIRKKPKFEKKTQTKSLQDATPNINLPNNTENRVTGTDSRKEDCFQQADKAIDRMEEFHNEKALDEWAEAYKECESYCIILEDHKFQQLLLKLSNGGKKKYGVSSASFEKQINKRRKQHKEQLAKVEKLGNSVDDKGITLEGWLDKNNLSYRKSNTPDLFHIDCPHNSEHNGTDAYVFVYPKDSKHSGKFGFHCSHSSCKNHGKATWNSFKEAIGIEKEEYKPSYFFTEKGQFIPGFMRDYILEKYDVVNFYGEDGLYVYKDGIYNKDVGSIIQRKISDLLGSVMIKPSYVSDSIKLIEIQTLENDFNTMIHPNSVNFKNGFIDIKDENFNLIPHTPDVRSIIQIPVDWNPKANCANFDKFLNQVVNENDVIRIYEMIGLCLLQQNPFDSVFFLHGPKGRNGKTVLLKVIEKLVGKNNTSSTPLSEFEDNKFATADIYKKLVNIDADNSSKTLYDNAVSVLKKLSSVDTIKAQFKYQTSFEFTSFATMIISTNSVPRISNLDAGMKRRIERIEFPNKFDGKNPNTRNRAELLLELTAPDELEGIITCSLICVINAINRGTLTTHEDNINWKNTYETDQNPVVAFVQNHITEVEGEYTKNTDLRNAFAFWYKSAGHGRSPSKTLLDNVIPTIIGIFSGNVKRCRPTIDDKRVDAVSDIKLDYEDYDLSFEGDGINLP